MGAEEENAIVFPCPHVAKAFLKNEMLSSLFSVLFWFGLGFFGLVWFLLGRKQGKSCWKNERQMPALLTAGILQR